MIKFFVASAALAFAGGALAQAAVNSTTTTPQPPGAQQGQPRPGQFNPAGPSGAASQPAPMTQGGTSGASGGQAMGSGSTDTMPARKPARAPRADRG